MARLVLHPSVQQPPTDTCGQLVRQRLEMPRICRAEHVERPVATAHHDDADLTPASTASTARPPAVDRRTVTANHRRDATVVRRDGPRRITGPGRQVGDRLAVGRRPDDDALVEHDDRGLMSMEHPRRLTDRHVDHALQIDDVRDLRREGMRRCKVAELPSEVAVLSNEQPDRCDRHQREGREPRRHERWCHGQTCQHPAERERPQ